MKIIVLLLTPLILQQENIGLQSGLYDPYQFEINVENVVFQTEGESFYQGTIDATDDVLTPKNPFGSPDRNWFTDDIDAPITNKFYQNINQVISLDFDEEIEDRKIEDNSGNANYGEYITDYLINYDYLTREPSTDGIPEIDITEEDNDKKAY